MRKPAVHLSCRWMGELYTTQTLICIVQVRYKELLKRSAFSLNEILNVKYLNIKQMQHLYQPNACIISISLALFVPLQETRTFSFIVSN